MVVELLARGVGLGEVEGERVQETVGQVYGPVLELVGTGVAERVQLSCPGVLQGLRGLFAVGAVLIDRVRGLGVGAFGGQSQHGALVVQGVMEPLRRRSPALSWRWPNVAPTVASGRRPKVSGSVGTSQRMEGSGRHHRPDPPGHRSSRPFGCAWSAVVRTAGTSPPSRTTSN